MIIVKVTFQIPKDLDLATLKGKFEETAPMYRDTKDVDIKKDYITHFRLWGTNTDDNAYSLLYGNQVITDFEPGRLYMIDTTETHSAIALDDDVYTFFIALDLTAKDTLISPSNPKFP